MNPIKTLERFGQSVWLDYIRRSLLSGGDLARLIEEDGIRGVTSNPAIFEKAIAGSTDYTEAIADLAKDPGLDDKAVYERLAIADIQAAADLLTPVYHDTQGRDGYVSLEVSPRLAHDTPGTVQEARRLWRLVDRPNLMIKVPATPEGLPAMETLLAEGIHVNATLLFSIAVYEQVAERYLRALERRAADGLPLDTIAGVASFFVSRVDTAVDRLLDERRREDADENRLARLQRVQGRAAIANARLAYRRFKQLFGGERWQALASRGARCQRLLWASTGTKNPAYSDVRYIEELIGPDTVSTIPPATLDAFRCHGRPRASLEQGLDEAEEVLRILEQLNISLDEVTARLLREGLEAFVEAFDKLLHTVASARAQHADRLIQRQTLALPADFQADVEAVLEEWQAQRKMQRLWARDPWLWTGKDEGDWLDWLDVTREQLDHLGDLRRIFQAVEGRYFRHAVLLGMGGSSLAPEVLRRTFGVQPDHPEWIILDSTDPAQIRAVEARIDYTHTLFLVSSKSGGTLEPNILKDYFFSRACESLGEALAPRHFCAVTDPGSALDRSAQAQGFRRIFYGKPGIGGRYSALSNFGMVPAAAMGIDVTRFLDRTEEMVEACAACVPVRDNPGMVLGAVLGAGAVRGCDKLTLIASPGIAALGAWLEQLLAESTGKEGKALIPVDGEIPGSPESYGGDRLFVYLRLDQGADPEQDAAVARLEQAGRPLVRIGVAGLYDLGQEFFRWEIATAVAGAILGINPFDQPDVEASKIATRRLTEEYERTGVLPEQAPVAEAETFRIYTDANNETALREIMGGAGGAPAYLEAHFSRVRPGDYIALLAYLDRLNPEHEARLQAIRHLLRDRFRVATCLGYGPRFLHSTGQAYKGGPNTGVFLQITCDDARDLPVPGHRYSFGVVKAAQARGDLQVLAERGRRVLGVHLSEDTEGALEELEAVVAGNK